VLGWKLRRVLKNEESIKKIGKKIIIVEVELVEVELVESVESERFSVKRYMLVKIYACVIIISS